MNTTNRFAAFVPKIYFGTKKFTVMYHVILRTKERSYFVFIRVMALLVFLMEDSERNVKMPGWCLSYRSAMCCLCFSV